MLLLGSTELSENLHEINGRMRAVLDSLGFDSTQANFSSRAATPQQMAGLLSQLMRAGQWLRTLPLDRGPDLERELNAYRKNVEHLRAVLPAIHSTLLRERARLEQERSQVQTAAAWAAGSRQTL